MDATDQEDNDQQPDFRLLLANPKGTSQALPSKDAKAAQDPAAVLEEQYNAFFQVLAEERHAAERTFSRAVFESDLGLFRLLLNKGTHFVSMGHTLHGQIYLYPEEALYLVDRGSLLVDYQGVNMSVQQMWTTYLTCNHNQKTPALAMERYLAYAYLKRLGFIVIRPGTYGPEGGSSRPSPPTAPGQALTRSTTTTSVPWLFVIWRTFTDTWRHHWRSLVSSVGLRQGTTTDGWTKRPGQPLVSNDTRLSYDQILQKLQIIPSARLIHTSHRRVQRANEDKRSAIDFEVYKPAGSFKKRQPGTPDYRVVVVESTAMLPSLGELSDMMDGQQDPAQDVTSSINQGVAGLDKGKARKVEQWPQILFAVVSGGQVSFMSMFNTKAVL